MNKDYNYIDINDDDGDINYEYSDLIQALAKKENVGITSDRDIFEAISDNKGTLVGASWTSWDGDNYEWDVVVDQIHQGNGIGTELIDSCISNFDEYKDINKDSTMNITVTNEIMSQALMRRGFKTSLKISDSFYKMEHIDSLPKTSLKKKNTIKNNNT
jgi:GNAT superfamily N-acetyltransferase